MRRSCFALVVWMAACGSSGPGPDHLVAADLARDGLADLAPPDDLAVPPDLLPLPLDMSSSDLAEAGPCFVAMPAVTQFLATRVGMQSKATTLTLTNQCRRDTTVTAIALAGKNAADFLLTNLTVVGGAAPTFPLAAPHGYQLTGDLIFSPSALGLRQAGLIVTEGMSGPGVVSQLSGVGQQ